MKKMMHVTKRDGSLEPVAFDKITERLRKLVERHPSLSIDYTLVAQKTIAGLTNGIHTSELDNLAAETAAAMATLDYEYDDLAARIAISNLQKETPKSFSEAMKLCMENKNPQTGKPAPLLDPLIYHAIETYADVLNAAIRPNRDFKFDFFGFKTLCHKYLLSPNGSIAETPQYSLMRVALGVHKAEVCKGIFHNALRTYDYTSRMCFTFATPTRYNAGTTRPQMASCFLLTIKADSVEGMYDTLKDCAVLSKNSGGLGIHISNVRSKHSYINGTNGQSDGLIPMLRVYNNTALHINQSGKRKGAFAPYLDLWHPDIFDFLQLRKNNGAEETRARDLFLAVGVPDRFMKEVERNGSWALIDPTLGKLPNGTEFADLWGEEWETRYDECLTMPGVRIVKAQDLMKAISEALIEGGTPYMYFRDAANRKSNQQNIGTIHCSNLCAEIIEYSSPTEIAVCNLGSVSLPACLEYDTKTDQTIFNHLTLFDIVCLMTRDMNNVIDENYYPLPETRKSNLTHRPLGIAVQGLAQVFFRMKMGFTSPAAKKLNQEIAETMYYAALTTSCDLAARDGPYETYQGSPASQGILQFDMWGVTPSSRWDWDALKSKIFQYGLRNSLLLANVPTASTSQILGNTECFEPVTSNLYVRHVLAGQYTVVNRDLVHTLREMGLWNEVMKDAIVASGGSVQNIASIPQEIKEIYKTVWELKMRDIVDMARDRGAFICQSQSLNLFLKSPTIAQVSSMLHYAWQCGLKTTYYLRSRAAIEASPVTLAPKSDNGGVCRKMTRDDGSVCVECSA